MSIVASILTGGVNNHATTNEEANALSTDFVSPGVVGTVSNTSGVSPATGGYAVNATGTPDANIQISAGTAYVTATPSTQGSQTIRLKNSATITQAISANSSGSTKYDWVYLSVDATVANAPNTAGDDVGSISVSRSSSAASDDGTPPTYGILLAVVTVANGFTTITNSVIRDRRTQTTIGATSSSPDTFWTTGVLPAVSSVTENGNRSASITFASIVASILTPGMRIRTSRTVAAPTYMGGAFNGTNHYFTKVTATSTLSTVTDNFTFMCFAEPTSYQQGSIAVRSDAAANNSIFLRMESDGRVTFGITSGGAANTRTISTYQSLPLNKKTHVAASWATGTVVIYFDGISVPVAAASTGGTAPTTAGTGGDFSIGRFGAANSQYFAGYLSGCGVFNAVLSAATIRSYKNQVLSGSETNCIGAWSLNNTGVNQQAAGTNDLTATNSVGYTTRSPYTTDANGVPAGTYDYAIVTKVATTVATVQYPEGGAIPTSGGISTVDYSGVKAPFGMPTEKGRWDVQLVHKASNVQAAVTTGTVYNPGGVNINTPIGAWYASGLVFYTFTGSTTADKTIQVGLSTSSSVQDGERSTYLFLSGQTVITNSTTITPKSLVVTTATPLYVLFTGSGGGVLTNLGWGTTIGSLINLEFALL